MEKQHFLLRFMATTHSTFFLILSPSTFLLLLIISSSEGTTANVSMVGDPGMSSDSLRVAFEAWNFCNEVGSEAPHMGSPRAADCFDLLGNSTLKHRVKDADNKLGLGTSFSGLGEKAAKNADLYAAKKEVYLGSLCEVPASPGPWQFWMVMLKNGNFDTTSGLCPSNGKRIGSFRAPGRFPCFGKGCMNQPDFYHQPTALVGDGLMRGWFNGSYDNGTDIRSGIGGKSFYEVVWEKKIGSGGWVFKHTLQTNNRYPWLMLYLRADATKGLSGGYHYDTRGMLKSLPESPNFKVKLRLNVTSGGGAKSQFYLIDMGGCWKNNGSACDGDVLTDVTRYSEMIINPDTPAWCSATAQGNCPPYHITPDDTVIYRNDTGRFPYPAYHYYCAPGNARFLEPPYSTCDPYSNPQAQELVQLLPHPVWSYYGYPKKQGDGWIGDARSWELDVGALSQRLYFYQDPGSHPARRQWPSLDVGTEIFVSDKEEVAQWTLSDFDVIHTTNNS